jgi:hypothetical protein
MTDPRTRPDDDPNAGGTTLEDDIVSLQGDVPPIDQDAIFDVAEIERGREPTRGEQDSGAFTVVDRAYVAEEDDPSLVTSLDAAIDTDLREEETDDPLVAIEDGFVYVPPSDPPVMPSDAPGGIDVAAGIGTGDLDEPFDDSHRRSENLDEGDFNARIRDALRSDGSTAELADRLVIAVVGSTVVIRGQVDEIDDGDAIAAVVETVPGVTEVRDETEVASLG